MAEAVRALRTTSDADHLGPLLGNDFTVELHAVAQPPAVDNPYVTEVVLRTRPC